MLACKHRPRPLVAVTLAEARKLFFYMRPDLVERVPL